MVLQIYSGTILFGRNRPQATGSIAQQKHLDNLPPRILRFRLRLGWYTFTISHVSGKLLYTADALSRAPSGNKDTSSKELEDEVETYITVVFTSLPATPKRLCQYREAQSEDPECSLVAEYCKTSWPDKQAVKPEFNQCMRSYGYPQSNGQAERMVQTVKRLLKKLKDLYRALLSYRPTPLPWCNLSPSELVDVFEPVSLRQPGR